MTLKNIIKYNDTSTSDVIKNTIKVWTIAAKYRVGRRDTMHRAAETTKNCRNFGTTRTN